MTKCPFMFLLIMHFSFCSVCKKKFLTFVDCVCCKSKLKAKNMHAQVFCVSNLGFLKYVSTDKAYDLEMLPQYNISINSCLTSSDFYIFAFYWCFWEPTQPHPHWISSVVLSSFPSKQIPHLLSWASELCILVA